MPRDDDVIVVGAGPAGLMAATYLARYRRNVLVVDGGRSRASWIPESHNTPGFDKGIGGEALLGRMRAQALTYGARIVEGRVEGLRQSDGFEVTVGPSRRQVPFVILANGIEDQWPDLPGLHQALRDSRARVCPICDAYEAIDRRVAVLGDGDLGAREALFLRHYSPAVTLLSHRGAAPIGCARLEDLARAGVERVTIAPGDLTFVEHGVRLGGGGAVSRDFDHLYLALGCRPATIPMSGDPIARDEDGMVRVDAHQQTTVDGLYAAGDIVRGLNQIAVATAEAAIAATAVHNRLREMDA